MSKTNRANICIDCQNACGKCSWSASTPDGKLIFQPVPGWTAEPVILNFGFDGSVRRMTRTYRITACPQFKPDPQHKRNRSDCRELTEEESRAFLARRAW